MSDVQVAQGHMLSPSTAFFYKAGTIEKLYGKQWIRKYAVLEGPFVHIFKKASTAQSVQAQSTAPRGRISNNQLTASPTTTSASSAEQSISLKFVANLAVAIRKDGGRSFFFVSNFDGTSHCFAADSVAELGPWVESITKALEYYNPSAVVSSGSVNSAPKQMFATSHAVDDPDIDSEDSDVSDGPEEEADADEEGEEKKEDKEKKEKEKSKNGVKPSAL